MAVNDFVRTPECVTKVLLRYENFSGTILEPCCGDGAIAEVLLQQGLQVTSSDKNGYGYGKRVDLFDVQQVFPNIITNPPFSQQQAIKKHLLSITESKLALLWYVKNLGAELETKTAKNLKNVYLIQDKIGWVEAKLNWKFAWYVWEKGYEGDVTIKKVLAAQNGWADSNSNKEETKMQGFDVAKTGRRCRKYGK